MPEGFVVRRRAPCPLYGGASPQNPARVRAGGDRGGSEDTPLSPHTVTMELWGCFSSVRGTSARHGNRGVPGATGQSGKGQRHARSHAQGQVAQPQHRAPRCLGKGRWEGFS